MNVHDLQKTYMRLWPERIRIDDGYASGSGFMFPTLNQIHDAIEDSIDHKTDHWGNVFTWSMSQACHGYARKLLEQGAAEMLVSEVSLEIIDQWIVGNLKGEAWVEERALYVPLGSTHSLWARRP